MSSTFKGVDPNIVKVEGRVYSPPVQRAGGFSRLLSAFGVLATPVGFATAPLFPPMAILGGFGLTSQYAGAHFQNKAVQNQMGGAGSYTPVAYPGLTGPVPQAPGGGSEVMDIIVPRNEMAMEMTQLPQGK